MSGTILTQEARSAYNPGGSAGGGSGPPSTFNTGKQTWVDSVFGNDSTGARQNSAKPFLTIGAALAASISGDTISVAPGSYTEINLTANGVAIYFYPGSSVSSTATTATDACFKFDASHNFTIYGKGNFTITKTDYTHGNLDYPCIFRTDNVSVSAYCSTLSVNQTGETSVTHRIAFVHCAKSASTLKIFCDSIGGNHTSASYGVSLAWLPAGAYGLFYHETASTVYADCTTEIYCTGAISTFNDGYNDGSIRTRAYKKAVVVSGDAILISERLIALSDSTSLFKAPISQASEWSVGEFTGSPVNMGKWSSDDLQIGQISTFNDLAASSLIVVSCATLICDSVTMSGGTNGTFILNAARITSVATPDIASLQTKTILNVGVWVTQGQGFTSDQTGNVIIGGSMVADAGFDAGNTPILAGNLIINPSVT